MIGYTEAAVCTLCPVSSRITDQIAADENTWLPERVPACLWEASGTLFQLQSLSNFVCQQAGKFKGLMHLQQSFQRY